MPRFDGSLTRFEIGEHRERRGQQFVDGRGYGSDHFEDVHRLDPHGFASRPVPGGLMYAIQARGNRDLVFGMGGEKYDLRPSGEMLTPGGAALYDHLGNIVSVVAKKLRIVHAEEVYIKAPSIVLDGAVKLGGPDADRPASAQGTIDSDGDRDVSNFASQVLVK